MRDYRLLPYEPDKPLELAPDIRKWLPPDHLGLFISDVVDTLDLREITKEYLHLQGGHPAYHPTMMLKLLFYGYCVGIRSSRRIEQKTYEDVAFRVLSGDSHPDHSRISDFRRHHLRAISRLFIQVLGICKEAGLVKPGHVALDGTKIKANASKRKAMSYSRMVKREGELAREVDKLPAGAEALDEKEDKKYGKNKRGDELPQELRLKEKRLEKIREAKRALEQEALREAKDKETRDKDAKPPTGGNSGPPTGRDVKPEPKKQRNFTDPDSRVMRDSATKGFEQAYNAQAGVDCDSQVIVAADVTQQANDKQQLVPMLEQTEENLGEIPDRFLADPGYFSEENVVLYAASWSPLSLAIVSSTPMLWNRVPGEEFLTTCRWSIECCASSRQRRGKPLLQEKGKCRACLRIDQIGERDSGLSPQGPGEGERRVEAGLPDP